jgi:hypothetical protein
MPDRATDPALAFLASSFGTLKHAFSPMLRFHPGAALRHLHTSRDKVVANAQNSRALFQGTDCL